LKYFDVPKYKVRPRPDRFLFNRLILSIGLGIFLYIIIYANYYLLNESIPSYINWFIIVGILLWLCIELISCYVRFGNYYYEFFEQKVIMHTRTTKSVNYDELKHISYSSGFVDKWFKTGSMVLELKDGKSVRLKYLDNPNQAYSLMQKYVKF
jgi:hypothetical protein